MALTLIDMNVLVRHFTQDNAILSPKATAYLNISFTDAYHAVLMAEDGLSEIATLDRDFDRVPGIHRIEP